MDPKIFETWEAECTELAAFGKSNYPNTVFAYTEPCVMFLAINYIAQKEPHVCEAVDLAFSQWEDIADIECLLQYVRDILEHENLLAGEDGEQSAGLSNADMRGYG